VLPLATVALMGAFCFVAGAIVAALVIWDGREAQGAELRRQLMASRKSSAEHELEAERLDQRLWEAEAEILRLRSNVDHDPEAAQ